MSGGLHGVGISVVNALSEWLEVEVTREEKKHSLTFARIIFKLHIFYFSNIDLNIKHLNTGTRVVFKPDPQIFKTTTEFEYDKLAARLNELAYLNAGITITMIDKRSKIARQYKNQMLLQDMLLMHHLCGQQNLQYFYSYGVLFLEQLIVSKKMLILQ